MSQELEDTLKKVRAELRERRAKSGDEPKQVTLDEETCRELEQFAITEKGTRRDRQHACDTDDLPVLNFGDDS